MTVRELIRELLNCDMDDEVWVVSDDAKFNQDDRRFRVRAAFDWGRSGETWVEVLELPPAPSPKT